MPRMEGIDVYKEDSFIGKQISALKVMPGKLDISLQRATDGRRNCGDRWTREVHAQ